MCRRGPVAETAGADLLEKTIELRGIERLGQQRYVGRIIQPLQLRVQNVATDEGEPVEQLASALPDAVVQRQAASVRHLDVAEDDVVLVALEEQLRHLAIERKIHHEAAPRQEALQQR